MRKKFKLILPLLAFLLSSLTVQAAPAWETFILQEYTKHGTVPSLKPTMVGTDSYVDSFTVSGTSGSTTFTINSNTSATAHGSIGSSNINLTGDAVYMFKNSVFGRGTGIWLSQLLPVGSYSGYFTISFSPSFYMSSTPAVWILGIEDCELIIGDQSWPMYPQSTAWIAYPNFYNSDPTARMCVKCTFVGGFQTEYNVSLNSNGAYMPNVSDMYRVNLGAAIYSQDVKYWSGNINDPENIDDFTAANNAFDSSLAAGEAAEKNLTDTAFVDVGSAADEYFVNPASGVLSGAAFYTACVTGLYNSLGDFQYILLIIITFIILRFIFRKVKGG